MIPDEDAEGATEFLRDRAKLYGQLRGHMRYTNENLRRVKALQMMDLEGGLGERETKALASDAYGQALLDLREAEAAYETERALRDAAEFRIEVWRSLNKTRGQG